MLFCFSFEYKLRQRNQFLKRKRNGPVYKKGHLHVIAATSRNRIQPACCQVSHSLLFYSLQTNAATAFLCCKPPAPLFPSAGHLSKQLLWVASDNLQIDGLCNWLRPQRAAPEGQRQTLLGTAGHRKQQKGPNSEKDNCQTRSLSDSCCPEDTILMPLSWQERMARLCPPSYWELLSHSCEHSHERHTIYLGNLTDQTFPFMEISPKKNWAGF